MPTPLVVALLLATAQSPQEVSATLTELATVSAARQERVEVLSTRDIERMVALESQKELVGCDSSTDCLAEVAGALGARLVVFGELGALDDQLLLTLNLYDANEARSVGREVVRGDSLTAIADGIEAGVIALLSPTLGGIEVSSTRVLVMQIKTQGISAAEEGPSSGLLSITGLSVVGLGAAVAVVGVLSSQSDAEGLKAETTQRKAAELQEARDQQALLANVFFVSGAIVAGAGAGLWLLGME